MIRWEPIKGVDLHKGATGYVSFSLPHSSVQQSMILCEVVDVKGTHIEIIPVASDKTCFWINAGDMYTRNDDPL